MKSGMSAGMAVQTEAKTLEEATRQFIAPENAPPDRRKGADFQATADLIGPGGPWYGDVESLGVVPGPKRSVISVWRINRGGQIWNSASKRPEFKDEFKVGVIFLNNYPMVQAGVRFLDVGSGGIPFNPHVVHQEFPPDPRGLPPELHGYIEQRHSGGAGVCCYARSSEWGVTFPEFGLPRLLYQVSLILAGQCIFAEGERALNQVASEAYMALRRAGKLPFGPALPPGALCADTQPAE